MKKNRLSSLTFKEFSLVRKPAHEGATVDLTKAYTVAKSQPDTGDVAVACASCKTPMSKSTKYCPECGAAMAKAAPIPQPTPEKKTMTTEEIAALNAKVAKAEAERDVAQSQLAKAQKLNELNDVQRLHYKRLGSDDQVAFLAKSAADRAKECEPIYKSDSGLVFTSADDPRMIEMAKSADAKAKADAIKLEKAEATILEKRAETEFAHLPGTAQERAALLKAAESIPDEKLREGAVAALKAHDAQMAKGFTPQGLGVTKSADTLSAEAELEKLAKTRAVAEKIDIAKAMDDVLQTDEGQKLYAKINTPRAN